MTFRGVVRRVDRPHDFGFIARDEKDVTDEVPRRPDIFFSPRHADPDVAVDDLVQYTRICKSEGFVATEVRLLSQKGRVQGDKRAAGGGGGAGGGGPGGYARQEYPPGWHAERIYRGKCVSSTAKYGFIRPSGRTREDPTQNVYFHFSALGNGQSGVPIGQPVSCVCRPLPPPSLPPNPRRFFFFVVPFVSVFYFTVYGNGAAVRR